MKAIVVFLALAAVLCGSGCGGDGWIPLFDGESLDGWKASENVESFYVKDGMICCDGDRSHLFYTGEVNGARFTNFEFKTDVMTRPGANSGIYFHTEFQQTGWPGKGNEVQVNNSQQPHGSYYEYRKTGSLYGIRNLYKPVVGDDVWFDVHVAVRGRNIRVKVNGRLVVDYTKPLDAAAVRGGEGRPPSSGTFAFQCHDPGSNVFYRNVMVKPLPDAVETPSQPASDPELEARLGKFHRSNFPLIDFHAHLKGGLTLEQAMAQAREYGINYGIAVNCGLGFPIQDDDALNEFVAGFDAPEAFVAMQAEGREWVDMFSPQSLEKFDYVFTDAMTWTNRNGKRMRLWIEDEVEIGDPEDFMEQLVNWIEKILNNEPVDIYVNPTFLPQAIAGDYDVLWTEERMDRVINVLAANEIALEINDRYRLPSPGFIKRAKAAGVKFTFGTNNGGAELGHLSYCLEMIEQCGLTSRDMWMPEKYRPQW